MNGINISGEVYASQTVEPDGSVTKFRSDYIEGIMTAYGFKPSGGTNVFKEVDMNERMTRKELTAKVKELEDSKFDELYDLRLGIDALERQLRDLGTVIRLIEDHLGVIATETEAVPSKLVLKKVRKPYTKKQ